MLQRNLRECESKKYVSVIVCYPDGLDQSHAQILRIQFRDGTVWVVDKTRKGFWAAAQKAGGRGMLYPILATPKSDADSSAPTAQRELKLFHDDDAWFVEIDDDEQGVKSNVRAFLHEHRA